jgi:sulfite exporter TauE/SafE
MSGLILGVFVSSLLGSVHCAGMCGPLVAAYSGMPGTGTLRRNRALAHGAYSVGRLSAYLVLGSLAGAFGAAVDHAAGRAGITRAAAVLSGAVIALWGLHAFLAAAGTRLPRVPVPRLLSRGLGSAMRAVANRPPTVRAFILGLGSALLPCGWLYAFVVTAGGTGRLLSGAAVMAVFWAGTLPLMLAFGEAVSRLSGPLRRHVPATCALALMILGLWTVFGRAHLVPSAVGSDAARPPCHGTR